MNFLVALDAKSYEILGNVIAEPDPPLYVMDLKILHSSARLAPPAISLQNFPAELAISFGLKFQAWPLCSDFFRSVTCTSSMSPSFDGSFR
jgi:hypothetical protein